MSDSAYINDLETRIGELERELAAAIDTIKACKQAAQDALDDADSILDDSEGYGYCHAGLRYVIARIEASLNKDKS